MIRMSKETDYGILLLTQFARVAETSVLSARELANETRVPLPTVSKILKGLARGGVLNSQRGARGGYTLARTPDQISIADVIVAMEGPVALTECVEHPGDCLQEHVCGNRRNWEVINQAVLLALRRISLAEMARPLGDQLVTLSTGDEATDEVVATLFAAAQMEQAEVRGR